MYPKTYRIPEPARPGLVVERVMLTLLSLALVLALVGFGAPLVLGESALQFSGWTLLGVGGILSMILLFVVANVLLPFNRKKG